MHSRHAVVICGSLLLAPSALAELGVPSIFTDHMVLQQGKETPIWGWAEPGTHVQVKLDGVDGAAARVRTGADGRWTVQLPAMEASSTPRDLVIRTRPASENIASERIVVNDVLVGEVWICSGQSNMEWTLEWCGQSDIDTSTADHELLRMFTARKTSMPDPQGDVVGDWVVCGPETAPGLSAVAYYFGRELQRALDVPVGLIHTSWGGSTAEAWTTRSSLDSMEETRPILERFDAGDDADPDTRQFTSITFDDTHWPTTVIPSMFHEQGHDIDGSIWYRHHFDVPKAWDGRALEVQLGSIDDADRTWFNGLLIGQSGRTEIDRRYIVPGSVVRSGPGLLTIRVTDYEDAGGFRGPVSRMRIGPIDSPGDRRMLTGSWLTKVSDRTLVRPMNMNHRPEHLYNGMIHPLVPYGVRGVIWYQGESNVGRADQYSTLFPAMIRDWRAAWKAELPFFFVQIAPYDYGRPLECAELREAQADALKLPATGMVVTMDIGDPDDIHPLAKEPVGRRLALLARRDVYGHDVIARAPTLLRAEAKGSVFVLEFQGACMPLKTADDAAPVHFELAGDDRVFHPAGVVLKEGRIHLESDKVAAPVAARYAWDDDAETNLIGDCGLPLAPFRTDSWPRVTTGRR
ncbi:MAG: hypothetical protein CMJ24_06905 [Phycisphaerae bacterium]|nr:hypothetical protein [Phycisphaerae bacterium]|tara:strand:- start:9590 stop:11485 length:1896 start_codon:yes stop_codon:yes gene_type:complete